MSKCKLLGIRCETRYRYRTGSKKERGEILRKRVEHPKGRFGSHIRKIYQPSHPPYQRLLACPSIDSSKKKQLREIYKQLNPFELRRQVQTKLRMIFQLLNQPRAELLAS